MSVTIGLLPEPILQPLPASSPPIAKAIILSLIESAKFVGHNPETYLADILARINDHKINRLNELLPWNWQPPVESKRQNT